MKTVACYVRVSNLQKNQGQQKRAINQWLKRNRINSKNVRWYDEKATEVEGQQPVRDKLQDDIREGDVRAVIVWHLGRLSPTTREGLELLIDWCNKSLRIVSVSQQIDIKSGDGRKIASVLRAVAGMDQETRRERTNLGLAAARAVGRFGGRPKVAVDDAIVRKAKKLQKDMTLSVDDICKRLKISRSTYYRYVGM